MEPKVGGYNRNFNIMIDHHAVIWPFFYQRLLAYLTISAVPNVTLEMTNQVLI